ncbi:FAD-binding protein [Roseateles chitinivorans]|uniref:FAD-binding protein n=1 Tax=Roseateles chitinivorans TaxID=2917965 RepID=UPI003D67C19F
MDRRRFLVGSASALSGGWLAGCGGGGGEAGTPVSPAPSPGPEVTDQDLATLAAQMSGRLLKFGDADFPALRLPANARFDGLFPRALARCEGAADVGASLAFVKARKMTFALRSGAHSYIGASTTDGLLIDTGLMDGVRMEGDILVAGAGAKLADVYRTAFDAGRILASGSCITVGITGITLGGGIGFFDRQLGLTCDALVRASVITADGQTRVCDDTQNQDLFWGLRGGGGGQFGIVTELRFVTQPMSAVSAAAAAFKTTDLAAVLAAWQAWPDTLPDWGWSQLAIASDRAGGLQVTVLAVAMQDADTLRPQWNALLAATGSTPQSQFIDNTTAASLLLSGCAGLSNTACHLPTQVVGGMLPRVSMTASSDYFLHALPSAGIQALGDALLARSRAGRPGMVLLDLMGGAIARVAPDATAFPHRAARFSAQYLTENPVGTPEATLNADALWATGLRDTMRPWSTGGTYVNYPSLENKPSPTAYFGSNVDRLKRLKASVDPDNVFRSPNGTPLV